MFIITLLFSSILLIATLLLNFVNQDIYSYFFGILSFLGFACFFFISGKWLFKKRESIKNSLKRSNFFAKSLKVFLVLFLSSGAYSLFYFKVINYQKDFNQNKLYTLSDFSLKIANEIKEPIAIDLYAYKREAQDIERYMKLYEKANPFITFTRKNLAKHFVEMSQNDITSSGTVLIYNTQKKIKILPQQIVKKKMEQNLAFNEGEAIYYERIVNTSLVSLTQPSKKIYFLSNLPVNGLKEFTAFQESVKILNFQIEWVSDITSLKMTNEDLLIIFDYVDISLADYETITNYLLNSGKLMLFLEPLKKKHDFFYFDKLLEDLKLTIDPTQIIVDPESYYLNYYDGLAVEKRGSPLFPQYDFIPLPKIKKAATDFSPDKSNQKTYHPIITPLVEENWSAIFRTILPITIQSNAIINYTPLLASKLTSWGESNLLEEMKNKKLEYSLRVDVRPPLNFVIAGEGQENDFKLLLVGDVDLLRNGAFFDGANEVFLMNSLFWLQGKNNLISQGVKAKANDFIYFSEFYHLLFFAIFLIFIPVILFLIFLIFKVIRIKKTL